MTEVWWGHELGIKDPEENKGEKVGYMVHPYIMKEGQFFVEQLPTKDGSMPKTPIFRLLNKTRQSTGFVLIYSEEEKGYILIPGAHNN